MLTRSYLLSVSSHHELYVFHKSASFHYFLQKWIESEKEINLLNKCKTEKYVGKSIQQEVTDVIKRESNNKKVFGTKEKTENLSHICDMSK